MKLVVFIVSGMWAVWAIGAYKALVAVETLMALVDA